MKKVNKMLRVLNRNDERYTLNKTCNYYDRAIIVVFNEILL